MCITIFSSTFKQNYGLAVINQDSMTAEMVDTKVLVFFILFLCFRGKRVICDSNEQPQQTSVGEWKHSSLCVLIVETSATVRILGSPGGVY